MDSRVICTLGCSSTQKSRMKWVLKFKLLEALTMCIRWSGPYQVVISANRHLTSQLVWQCNGPKCSDRAAIVPGSKNGYCGRRYIILRWCGQLNATVIWSWISFHSWIGSMIPFVMDFSFQLDVPDCIEKGELVKIQQQGGTKIASTMFYSLLSVLEPEHV